MGRVVGGMALPRRTMGTPLRVVAALRVVVAFVVVVGGAAAAILIFKGLESMEHELVLRCARRNWVPSE